MVSPSEIFLGFCNYYNTLRIFYYESISIHTLRVTSYWDELGLMLGYRIFSEASFKELFKLVNEECPKGLEKKKPDVCWGSWEDGELRYELVLESESEMDKDKIKEELEKLIVFPAKMKVLYCSHNNVEEIFRLIRQVINSYPSYMGSLLVIIDPWVKPSSFDKGEITGFLINSNKKISHQGSAHVFSYIDSGDKIRQIKNATWKSVQDNVHID